MEKYRITIIAEGMSSLPKADLESKLVASLFDIEKEEKVADGEGNELEIINYELTEAIPISS